MSRALCLFHNTYCSHSLQQAVFGWFKKIWRVLCLLRKAIIALPFWRSKFIFSCSSFSLKSTLSQMHESTCSHPFLSWQFHNSNCRYSLSMVRDVCYCKGNLRNKLPSPRDCSLGVVSLALGFFRSIVVIGSRYCPDGLIFVKAIYFFKIPLLVVHSLKSVSFYLKRGVPADHSFFQTYWLILEDQLKQFIFSCRVTFFHGAVAAIHSFRGYMDQIIFDSSYLIRTTTFLEDLS